MTCQRHHTNKITEPNTFLPLEAKKQLTYGQHVYIQATCGCLLRVKINGKPKTWKRSPDKVQVPYKYGFWEYGYITESTVTAIEA